MTQLATIGRHATSVTHEDGATVVRYHWTDVVIVKGRTVTLKANGYQTATTKVRMNQAARQFGLNYTVFQKDFGWYVDTPGGTLDFYDGITFDA